MKPNIVILLSQIALHWVRRNKKRGLYHDAGRIKVSPLMLSRVINYRNDGGGSTFRGWLLPFFIYDNTLFFTKFQVPLTHSNPFLMIIGNCSEELPRQFEFYFRRKHFIKLIHVGIVDIVSRRCLVDAGDVIQISGNQLFA